MEGGARFGVERVISGGQTGADRGALDAAMELGIPHGGACPRGRRAEDGRVPARYRLRELPTRDYAARTEANVLEACATVIVGRGPLVGGSELTRVLAERAGRPWLHLDLERVGGVEGAARRLRAWLARVRPRVLNVAGPRESACPGLQREVAALIRRALGADLSFAERSG